MDGFKTNNLEFDLGITHYSIFVIQIRCIFPKLHQRAVNLNPLSPLGSIPLIFFFKKTNLLKVPNFSTWCYVVWCAIIKKPTCTLFFWSPRMIGEILLRPFCLKTGRCCHHVPTLEVIIIYNKHVEWSFRKEFLTTPYRWVTIAPFNIKMECAE
jgi:hypothetical protein